jgi:hypothetical protein
MACVHVALPDGSGGIIRGIICGLPKPKKCCKCRGPADREYDWKVPGRKSGTCDRPVCSKCSVSPAPEKDLCPDHAAAWAVDPRNSRNKPACQTTTP